MRRIIRRIIFYTFSIFLTTLFVSGLKVNGGISTYLVAGFILSVMMFFLKPILNILAFPLNILTFGFFSVVVNGIILFLLTVIMPQVIITDFTFSHVYFLGFSTPNIYVVRILAFLVISVIISALFSAISWLTTDE